MNSKVSFVNFKYLKENLKKSRGIIFLFLLVIPTFTYLFMLLFNNASTNRVVFPSLLDLSYPALIGMYIIPFMVAVTLFNYLFKKDSVDFINAFPLKRKTIYITNIIGGIGLFFVIFLMTSLIMLLGSTFFTNLAIPSTMYFHFFLTFFIAYTYTFIASCFTLSLTGSRMVHVALTLILLFIPGFISDFYNSRVYSNSISDNYYYPTCNRYDTTCPTYEIYNDFKVEKSYRLSNGQTLPYKYINMVPRSFFSMNNNEVSYQNELSSVYNITSIIKMIFLSIVYFVLGLYTFMNRKMEIAEATFKNENIHQLVKCLTLFPLCLGAITLFVDNREAIILWIMFAIIITIYVVYDLITHRNSGKFFKSILYFVSLILATLLIYIGAEGISYFEANKVVNKDDIANVGIVPSIQLGQGNNDADLSILKYKITNPSIIKLIFDNANQKISNVNELSKQFALRLGLKNGATYYFNVRLVEEEYNKLLSLLDKDNDYAEFLMGIPYNKIYGVQLGDTYLDKKTGDKVVALIKDGYKGKKVSDIVNATYMDFNDAYGARYNLMNKLYAYDGGIKTYNVSTMINPKLIDYVMQMRNNKYIKDIKNNYVNINQLDIVFEFNSDKEINSYYKFVRENQNLVYRYINDNIKDNISFSKYAETDIAYITVYDRIFYNNMYQIYIPKDATYDKLFENAKTDATNETDIKGSI